MCNILLLTIHLALIFPLYAFVRSPFSFSRQLIPLFAIESSDVDPNFEAHLPGMLAAGLTERPSPDVASDLRAKFQKMQTVKRTAAQVLRQSNNEELAAELEELADELKETSDNFVAASMYWDAWNRPSPDLAKDLREKVDAQKRASSDPNYQAHVSGMVNISDKDRPSPDLPSELRLLKLKQRAEIKRLAAKEIRASGENVELAAELDEMADEIEESRLKFEKLAESRDASKRSESSTSNR